MLLFGSGMIAVPIVLHLLMQRKPQHLIFPALRFVKERRAKNQRRLQLRHLLLLFLRCLFILLLGLTLAKPSVASDLWGAWLIVGAIGVIAALVGTILCIALFWSKPINKALVIPLAILFVVLTFVDALLAIQNMSKGSSVVIGDRQTPVAAVLIFDTSPRMEYRQDNQTRLEHAQELSFWLANHFPPESQIAITHSENEPPFFSVDVSAAKKRISVLTTTYTPEPLTNRIESAIELLDNNAESSQLQKEIYVFSSMTHQSWTANQSKSVKDQLAGHPDLALYVIDVRPESPENFSLGNIQLKSQLITSSGQLEVSVPVNRLGDAGARQIRLVVEKPDPRLPTRRDGQTIVPDRFWERSVTTTVESNSTSTAQFKMPLSGEETFHGRVEIVGDDGLAFDDHRFFTVQVRRQWKIMVVSPEGVNPTNLIEALSPHKYREIGQAMYQCETVLQENISTKKIDQYDAVFLLDPHPLSQALWQQLNDYVSAGGKICFALGQNAAKNSFADPSFNSETAQKLMPGLLSDIWRSPGDEIVISPTNLNHPIMAPFRKVATKVPWYRFPIYRHWGLQAAEQADDTDIQVVTTFSNLMPAIVERKVGDGRVLLMTTPITDPARPPGRKRWNDLPLGDDCWPYFIIANQMADHLVASQAIKLNYTVGQTAILPNDADSDPTLYAMFSPRNEEPVMLPVDSSQLRYRFTETPGTYRLKGNIENDAVRRGFSVNIAASESVLATITEEELNEQLGDKQFQYAQNVEDIERRQGSVRLGREFYPLLLTLLTIVFAIELLFSNRFYQTPN